MFEIPVIERKEMAQFYLNKETDSWEKMSISPEPISEMMSSFKDFDELDKRELHLREFRALKSLGTEKDKDYLAALEKVDNWYKIMKDSYGFL